MEPIINPLGGQSAGPDPVKDTDSQNFVADVIETSKEVPVIVDFWAPWCGPCKQLTPLLEKVVRAEKGKVRLVKLNVDDNPQIAQQLRIQSLPTIYAFSDGKPVDGFQGALPESQLKEFVRRLAASGDDPVATALEDAEAALAGGDTGTAGAIFQKILSEDPGNLKATCGLARCLVAMGDLTRAEEVLDGITGADAEKPETKAARSALDLARAAEAAGDPAEFRARLEANPEDHQARFELAQALHARGDREGAVDTLLELVRRDRQWNDEAARKELVKYFEAFGPTDPLTVSGRRRLSSMLFS